jgi:nitrate reductase gamma subunit
MTLLEFARGPALQWSLIILAFGFMMRIVGALVVRMEKDYSTPRSTHVAAGAARAIFVRFWHHPEFVSRTTFHLIAGYVLHIGLFVVLLLFAPHIAFLETYLGFSWPALPNNFITLAAALTIGAMVAFLVRRLRHPVMRSISSFDDYFSWLVVFLPLVTGVMAYAHVGPRYETMLAIHILSAELLFIWLPFSKLLHIVLFIPSRAQLGAFFQRRGVKV